MRHTAIRLCGFLLACVLGLGACSPTPGEQAGAPTAAPAAQAPTLAPAAVPTLVPTAAPPPEPASAPTLVPTAAPTLAPTATPDPWAEYAPYTIEGLRTRSYGQGQIEIVRTLEELPNFTRYLIAYPSDGLRITGMLQIQSNKAFGTSGDRTRSE
jgi:hypothetical protein